MPPVVLFALKLCSRFFSNLIFLLICPKIYCISGFKREEL